MQKAVLNSLSVTCIQDYKYKLNTEQVLEEEMQYNPLSCPLRGVNISVQYVKNNKVKILHERVRKERSTVHEQTNILIRKNDLYQLQLKNKDNESLNTAVNKLMRLVEHKNHDGIDYISFSYAKFNDTSLHLQVHLSRIFMVAKCQAITLTSSTGLQNSPTSLSNTNPPQMTIPIFIDRTLVAGEILIQREEYENLGKKISDTIERQSMELKITETNKKYEEDLKEKVESLVQISVNSAFRGTSNQEKVRYTKDMLTRSLLDLKNGTYDDLRQTIFTNYSHQYNDLPPTSNKSLIAALTNAVELCKSSPIDAKVILTKFKSNISLDKSFSSRPTGREFPMGGM